jgi:hypothetical protein
MGSIAIRRWTPRRKANVIEDVKRGHVTREQACQMHKISRAEFDGWLVSYTIHGVDGLRAQRRMKS